MRWWAWTVKRVKELLFSSSFTCDCCGKELFDYPAHRLCSACENGLENNDGFTCDKCGRKAVTVGVCLTCKRDLPTFTRGVSPFVYSGVAAALVNRLKNGDKYLSAFFGERMAEAYLNFVKYTPEEKPLLIVPVPLTEQKRETRGYNQAEELAKEVSVCLERVGIKTELCQDAIIKTRESRQQKHLGVTERIENAQGAYRLHVRKIFPNRRVLLIDDIMTTGATGSVCAKLILNAHAKEVVFLTAVSAPERK